MGFYGQEDWRGLPFPSPGDLPNPGIKLGSCIAGRFCTVCDTRGASLPWYTMAFFPFSYILLQDFTEAEVTGVGASMVQCPPVCAQMTPSWQGLQKTTSPHCCLRPASQHPQQVQNTCNSRAFPQLEESASLVSEEDPC